MDSNAPTFPLTLGVYFGSGLERGDVAQVKTFASQQTLDAYLQGFSEADGYLGYERVDHADFQVNENGMVEEFAWKGRGPRPASSDRECFIVWGENPDEGDRPTHYTFDSSAERDAFLEGVEDFSGWTRYCLVPGPEFLVVDPGNQEMTPEAQVLAIVEPHLRDAVQQALAEGDYPDFGYPVFVRADGSYVLDTWQPGEGIRRPESLGDVITPEPAARRPGL